MTVKSDAVACEKIDVYDVDSGLPVSTTETNFATPKTLRFACVSTIGL